MYNYILRLTTPIKVIDIDLSNDEKLSCNDSFRRYWVHYAKTFLGARKVTHIELIELN